MMRRLVLFAALALSAAPARADLVFCNKFTHQIYIAVAYKQDGGGYISRGWLNVEPDQCSTFDTQLVADEIFYRAESVSFRDGRRRYKETWGNGDGSFAIWERDNFNYWNAQERVLNSSLAAFTKAAFPVAPGKKLTITIEAGQQSGN